MTAPLEDTIAAISTPPGKGGIGLLRLSGPKALPIAVSLMSDPRPLPPRRPTLRSLVHPATGESLEQAMLTYYAAPASYTGEEVVEISCHGSPVLLNLLLGLLLEAGARLATPGEYTLRAFLHGKMDLVQAEAVRDLIESQTAYQAKVAHQQACGALSQKLQPIKRGLVDLISLLEAGIDFAEDDLTVPGNDQILSLLAPLETGLETLHRSFEVGRLIHDGLTLAILGRPNVGKSSLFNRLLAEERAIVTEIPGTTRDMVSETAGIQGISVRLLDTAGIREVEDKVERIGIDKSYEAMAEADLILLVLDASEKLTEEDRLLLKKLEGRQFQVALNKSDLECRITPDELPLAPDQFLQVSAKTGEGLEELKNRLVPLSRLNGVAEAEGGLVTNLRHRQLIGEGLRSLGNAEQSIVSQNPHEIILLDLYAALNALNQLTGETTVEEILGNIFSKFCIGK